MNTHKRKHPRHHPNRTTPVPADAPPAEPDNLDIRKFHTGHAGPEGELFIVTSEEDNEHVSGWAFIRDGHEDFGNGPQYVQGVGRGDATKGRSWSDD